MPQHRSRRRNHQPQTPTQSPRRMARFDPLMQQEQDAKRRLRMIEQGHNVKYGVIAVHKDSLGVIRYFLHERRFSVAYQALVMGNFNAHDISFLVKLLQRTSAEERRRICRWSFKKIYCHLWGWFDTFYQEKYNRVKTKWNILRRGLIISTGLDTQQVMSWKTLCAMVAHSAQKKNTYEFPKGKREWVDGKLESEWDCAVREFDQETQYGLRNCRLVPFQKPLVETFVGMNELEYTHKYYLMKCETMGNHAKQSSEARRIRWLTLEEALENIWEDETSKRQMLLDLHKHLSSSSILHEVPHSPLPDHVHQCIARIVTKNLPNSE